MVIPQRSIRQPARLRFDEIMKNVSIRIWKQAKALAPAGMAVLVLAMQPVARAAEGGGTLPASVVQQIGALMQEKAARTPAQRKLDSQLVYAIKMGRNEPIAPGVPTQHLDFAADAQGRVLVDITAKVTDALLAEVRVGGGEVVNHYSRFDAIRAKVPLARLELLAGRQDVRFIRAAAMPVTKVGRILSEGDVTHRAGQARTNYTVAGAGVKIGVISDSVDFLGGSQASGDVGAVTVLPGQSGVPGSGEGTAMLEIVADLAPKAELFFATGGGGLANFAQNILDLRAAGCDIIVDDIGYLTEAPFQDDVLAQAVNTVTADGALFFSAAGNFGNKNDGTAATWEGDFNPGQPLMVGGNALGVAHSYGNTTANTVLSVRGGVALFWADPLGRSTNDYDLYIINPATSTVFSSSTTPQTGTQDPVEVAFVLPGLQIVVVKTSGDNLFIHFDSFAGGEFEFTTSGNIRGHPSTDRGFGVSAVSVATAFPNPFTGGAANPVERFTSDGPRRVFFDPQGNPLLGTNFSSTGGVVRNQPEISAADRVKTATPGFNPFPGTSAAAPHAAAIAALLKSYNPKATPQQIRFALTNSALDIEAPGFDRDAGWGKRIERCFRFLPL